MSDGLRVRLRLFAMLPERAGWRERTFELAQGATLADAWRAATAAAPALAPFGGVVRLARNGRYASGDEPLSDGDEVAALPPVAGGADTPDGPLLDLRLSAEPLADGLLDELRRIVPTTADGALVLFVGQTRETPGPPGPGEEESAARHAGEPVEGLAYEVYSEMALDVLREIGGEIEHRFGVRRLAIIHRSGHVALAEPSVVVAAAAPHRDSAFDACRYAIEQLKARAPIWKRELYAGGGVWSAATPEARAGQSGPVPTSEERLTDGGR